PSADDQLLGTAVASPEAVMAPRHCRDPSPRSMSFKPAGSGSVERNREPADRVLDPAVRARIYGPPRRSPRRPAMSMLRRSLLVAAATMAVLLAALPVSAGPAPTGERIVGNATLGHGGAIEPAYDYNTGNLTYILTPTGAPFPAKA